MDSRCRSFEQTSDAVGFWQNARRDRNTLLLRRDRQDARCHMPCSGCLPCCSRSPFAGRLLLLRTLDSFCPPTRTSRCRGSAASVKAKVSVTQVGASSSTGGSSITNLPTEITIHHGSASLVAVTHAAIIAFLPSSAVICLFTCIVLLADCRPYFSLAGYFPTCEGCRRSLQMEDRISEFGPRTVTVCIKLCLGTCLEIITLRSPPGCGVILDPPNTITVHANHNDMFEHRTATAQVVAR